MKKHIIIAIALLGTLCAGAAEPAGYYNAAENKGGQNLLSALAGIVGPHTAVGYDALLDLYKSSDVYPDGTIWDMYSTKHWNPGSTCGNYSNVGDCYNREHSFPKSWFSNGSPMNSDAFHVYPTDGKVNGQRSNYPYGECAGGTYLAAHNGVQPLGRLGRCTSPGYSGTVFEPDDQYKGDFARSYFYMATAYNSRTAGWNSDMLAGNTFPVFKQWAIDVLLKWHRQDPVSDKERARNEVVYGRQRNRNPYIDHPELAEYIWGNKSTGSWTSAGNADPEIILPAEGTSLDFGTTAVGIAASRSITIRTLGATANTTVAIAGAGFSASAYSLTAAQTNSANGAQISVTYNPQAVGNHSATLTLTCGTLSRTITLAGQCIDGLPAGPAQFVTDRSFRATWTYIGDDINGNYTLSVAEAGGSAVTGFPRPVAARTGYYDIEDLDPQTEYVYTVASRSIQSQPVHVTTGAPVPLVEFLFDGDLEFVTAPGEPSVPAEILLDVENIFSDITVTVTAPFQVSENRNDWSNTITLDPDADRFYLRLFSDAPGTFTAFLKATAQGYESEEIEIHGTASASPTFHEDFEADAAGFGAYDGHYSPYQGSAAPWTLSNAGIFSSDGGHESNQSVRFGKTNASSITMTADRPRGIGSVSFWAKYWGSESDPVIEIQISTDGGETFNTAANVTVASSAYRQYTVHAGVAGNARIRLQQTAGSRLNIDDIEISDYTSGLADPAAARHQWDAIANGNNIIIDVTDPRGVHLEIYALDGQLIDARTFPAGTTTVSAPAPGMYIIASPDFARRAIIR